MRIRVLIINTGISPLQNAVGSFFVLFCFIDPFKKDNKHRLSNSLFFFFLREYSFDKQRHWRRSLHYCGVLGCLLLPCYGGTPLLLLINRAQPLQLLLASLW